MKHKENFGYDTLLLNWSMPVGKNGLEPHLICCEARRATPVEVNSRPAACLTSFVTSGRVYRTLHLFSNQKTENFREDSDPRAAQEAKRENPVAHSVESWRTRVHPAVSQNRSHTHGHFVRFRELRGQNYRLCYYSNRC